MYGGEKGMYTVPVKGKTIVKNEAISRLQICGYLSSQAGKRKKSLWRMELRDEKGKNGFTDTGGAVFGFVGGNGFVVSVDDEGRDERRF